MSCACFLVSHLYLYVSNPLQSSSHIAASPKVSAKVKKDNVKYAAWAASQINRAYKVRDTIISSAFTPHRLHLSGKQSHTSKRLFPTSLARQWKPPIIILQLLLDFAVHLRTISRTSRNPPICIACEWIWRCRQAASNSLTLQNLRFFRLSCFASRFYSLLPRPERFFLSFFL